MEVGGDSSSKDSMTWETERHKERLERTCNLIVEQLVVEDILDHLVASGAVSMGESERLLDESGSRANRSRQLVYLFARKNRTAYSAFRQTLLADYPHLVDALDRTSFFNLSSGVAEDEVDGGEQLVLMDSKDEEAVFESAIQMAAAEPLVMRKFPQLARLLGISESTVAEFQDGANSNSSVRSQERLYSALTDWLATESASETESRQRLIVQLRHRGLTKLAQQLMACDSSDDWLLIASRSPQLAQRWSQVARSLGLAADQVAEYGGDADSLQKRTYNALRDWADCQEGACVSRLCDALGKLRLNRLRQRLLELQLTKCNQ